MSPQRQSNGQKEHEKMLKIISDRGMQIKTTMRYPFTTLRMVIIKKTAHSKCSSCGYFLYFCPLTLTLELQYYPRALLQSV